MKKKKMRKKLNDERKNALMYECVNIKQINYSLSWRMCARTCRIYIYSNGVYVSILPN